MPSAHTASPLPTNPGESQSTVRREPSEAAEDYRIHADAVLGLWNAFIP